MNDTSGEPPSQNAGLSDPPAAPSDSQIRAGMNAKLSLQPYETQMLHASDGRDVRAPDASPLDRDEGLSSTQDVTSSSPQGDPATLFAVAEPVEDKPEHCGGLFPKSPKGRWVCRLLIVGVILAAVVVPVTLVVTSRNNENGLAATGSPTISDSGNPSLRPTFPPKFTPAPSPETFSSPRTSNSTEPATNSTEPPRPIDTTEELYEAVDEY